MVFSQLCFEYQQILASSCYMGLLVLGSLFMYGIHYKNGYELRLVRDAVIFSAHCYRPPSSVVFRRDIYRIPLYQVDRHRCRVARTDNILGMFHLLQFNSIRLFRGLRVHFVVLATRCHCRDGIRSGRASTPASSFLRISPCPLNADGICASR